MEPVLKWAGGKRQLLPEINKVITRDMLRGHTFYEPFVGGGSVSLSYEHTSAVLSDHNQELMNVYMAIQNSPYELINLLKYHKERHSHDYYYEVRAWDRSADYIALPSASKAARIIYLNRTCYNGLYRVNNKGFFNVPIGRYVNPDILVEDKILKIHKYLTSNEVTLMCGDFRDAVLSAIAGDVIYFDPPYDYEDVGFTAYTPDSFSKQDLLRLKTVCDELIERGCRVAVSNNDTDYVRETFADNKYKYLEVFAKRMINCNGGKRKDAKEVIIYG